MFINTFILFPDHPPLGRHGVFVFRNEGNAESIGSWAHMMNSDDPQLGGTYTFPLFFHQWGQSLVRLGGRLGRLEGGALGNELRPWSSCATLMEPSAGDDELFIAALKRRLRGAGGPEPNDQYVRLAVSLACDPSLVPTTVCKAAVPPVTSSGTRQRILGYRDQIHRDGLLGVCSSQTSAQPVDPATAALSPEDQCRVKRAKQRRAQRAH